MIPQSNLPCQTVETDDAASLSENWQSQLINAVRDPDELLARLQIDRSQVQLSSEAQSDFPLLVPRHFVGLMQKGNPKDPLLLQVLNRKEEQLIADGFTDDPLAEQSYIQKTGLVHKYSGRVLLIVTGKCAINCRYCFRRAFPYAENNPGRDQWLGTLEYIHQDSSISEVIFSGGDPLSAPDRHLAWLTDQIAGIPHIRRLRIHTRLPVVIPARICDELIEWMSRTRLKIQLVLHINHAHEISDELEQRLKNFRSLGIHILNQSVLLKDINDNLDTLQALQERSFEAGILPYYLFCLDKVRGASHFDVTQLQARELLKELRKRLPGYLIPRLALEEPGKPHKTLLI